MANSWDEAVERELSRLAIVGRAFGLGSVLAVEINAAKPEYGFFPEVRCTRSSRGEVGGERRQSDREYRSKQAPVFASVIFCWTNFKNRGGCLSTLVCRGVSTSERSAISFGITVQLRAYRTIEETINDISGRGLSLLFGGGGGGGNQHFCHAGVYVFQDAVIPTGKHVFPDSKLSLGRT